MYQETVVPRDGLSVVGSFTLDAPLGTNVWISAHSTDEADLDTIEVISPSGRIFDLPQVNDGLLHIRITETTEVRPLDLFSLYSYSTLASSGRGSSMVRTTSM